MPPLKTGPHKGVSLDFDTMAQASSKTMGWDIETGIQDPDHLRRIGLEELVDSTREAHP